MQIIPRSPGLGVVMHAYGKEDVIMPVYREYKDQDINYTRCS